MTALPPAPLSPPARGPSPSANGAHPPPTLDPESRDLHREHAGRLDRLETVVGRPPYLDDPGAGIARAIHEVHGTVTSTRRILVWGLGIVAAAVLGREALTWHVVSVPSTSPPVVQVHP